MKIHFAILAFSLCASAPEIVCGAAPTFTDIAFPSATSTQAFGINNNGDIAGIYGLNGAPYPYSNSGGGFVYSGGSYTGFNVPNATATIPLAINNSGQIAGIFQTSGGGQHGFTKQGTTYTTIDYPSASLTGVFGENNMNFVVGYYLSGSQYHGFMLNLTNNAFTNIDFPNATFTNAYGINDAGQIVGFYKASGSGANHGFLLSAASGGTFTAINYPGASDTTCSGINSQGQIVGRYLDAHDVSHGFLLSGGVYTTVDPPSPDVQSSAFKINDSGQIVGYYDKTSTPSMHTGFVTSATTSTTPMAVNPAAGNGTTQAFNFTFTNAQGWQNLKVVDILINSAIDGRNACYVAYAPATATTGSLFLIDDAGDAGGPYAGTVMPSSMTLQNTQCAINVGASTVTASGNTLSLSLAVTFNSPFAGNKAFYLSSLDNSSNDTGWQAMGTWGVPGTTPTGPSVTGMTPSRSATASQTYTFTFSDTNGWQDLSVVNVLLNTVLDGRNACYLAYDSTHQTLYLVPDSGGGLLPGITLGGTGTTTNSQCTISSAGSSAVGSGNTLTLTLPITFNQSNPTFDTNQLFHLAAGNSTVNSGWQTVGTVTVP